MSSLCLYTCGQFLAKTLEDLQIVLLHRLCYKLATFSLLNPLIVAQNM